VRFSVVKREVSVSLPREWFKEIKRMMTVHSTHGLFLTCTQEFHLYLHNIVLINIYSTQCTCSIIEPLAKNNKEPQLGGPVSCSWGQISIHSGPLSGNNCPTLLLLPLSPLNPHYAIYNDDINNLSLLRPGKSVVE
jgi:hypothetical protein